MWRDYGDNILTYPSPANVYISSQRTQPDQKGETDMFDTMDPSSPYFLDYVNELTYYYPEDEDDYIWPEDED